MKKCFAGVAQSENDDFPLLAKVFHYEDVLRRLAK